MFSITYIHIYIRISFSSTSSFNKNKNSKEQHGSKLLYVHRISLRKARNFFFFITRSDKMDFLRLNGKRKFVGSSGSTRSPSLFDLVEPKNIMRDQPGREIVYTEDNVPVRKLYMSIPTADVSKEKRVLEFTTITLSSTDSKLQLCTHENRYRTM